MSATHLIANYNSFRPYGIVFLLKRNPTPTSEGDEWLETGLTFKSNTPDDKYGACISMKDALMVVGAPADSQNGDHNGAGEGLSGYCIYE